MEKPLPVDDPRRRKPDIAAARDLLGWKPRVPLASGLAKTIAWFVAEHISVEPGDRLGKQHSGRLSRRAGWSPAGTA